jgi:hypothetical protein
MHTCIYIYIYIYIAYTYIYISTYIHTYISNRNGLQNVLREDLEMAQDNKLMQLPVKHSVDEALEAYLKSKAEKTDDDKNMVEVGASMCLCMYVCMYVCMFIEKTDDDKDMVELNAPMCLDHMKSMRLIT